MTLVVGSFALLASGTLVFGCASPTSVLFRQHPQSGHVLPQRTGMVNRKARNVHGSVRIPIMEFQADLCTRGWIVVPHVQRSVLLGFGRVNEAPLVDQFNLPFGVEDKVEIEPPVPRGTGVVPYKRIGLAGGVRHGWSIPRMG